LRNKY